MNYTPEPIPTVTTAIEALVARGARLTVNTVNAELEALRGSQGMERNKQKGR